jgi:hypothetical protein
VRDFIGDFAPGDGNGIEMFALSELESVCTSGSACFAFLFSSEWMPVAEDRLCEAVRAFNLKLDGFLVVVPVAAVSCSSTLGSWSGTREDKSTSTASVLVHLFL